MRKIYENIKRYIHNIYWLRKVYLKLTTRFTYEEQLENILYYLPNSSVLRPNILSSLESIDKLISTTCSLARFGDGELKLIAGKGIPFQKYDAELARRLKEILASPPSKLFVGLCRSFYYPVYDTHSNSISKDYELYRVPKYRKIQNEIINSDLLFLSSEISSSVNHVKSKYKRIQMYKHQMYKFEKMRLIWDNKDIVLVTCKEALSGIIYNIFDNSKSIKYVFTPSMHAYSEYKRIYNDVREFSKDTLIILMVGPTATVLAADLSVVGYQALDLGHVLKSYDFLMKGNFLNLKNSNDFFSSDK